MSYETASAAIETLTGWGFHVVPGKTLGSQFNYFSGTDQQRFNDLQQMMDDEASKQYFVQGGIRNWEELSTGLL